LIWSSRRAARSDLKEGGHLKKHIGERHKNSGSPDKRKLWGDGGFVLASKRYVPRLVKESRGISTKKSLPAGFDKLENLSKLNKEEQYSINENILKLVSDKDILLASYSKLKSSPGNMTPGTDSETLDGINLEWFDKLQRELNTNKFQFRPTRRVEIPKPNGKGTRPLGVASPRDKIVQGAMLLVLEAIFEPLFKTHSHGFRPNKGCHSALGEIKRTFTSVN